MTEKPEPPEAFDTVAVRGGEPRRHAYSAVAMPIVCTATYSFESTQEIRDHFEGRIDREEYGRYGNPTTRNAERKLAALEGAEDALLFPSGMSAITTVLLAMLKPDDHIVMTADCYRRTRQFAQATLGKFGVGLTLVEPAAYDDLCRAIVPNKTRLIITEAPTNPYLRIADVPRVAEIRREFSRLKVIVDSTLATPFNFRPLKLGADLVIHSGTKYLAGHNDVLAGAVCGGQSLIDAFREARDVFGGICDPHGAYLLTRGLKTLGIRMRQHNRNGLKVAQFLEEHPRVQQVYYPGLKSHPDHEVAARLMSGYGGMVTFRVKSDLEGTARFLDALKLATLGPSMGGAETLIEQPAFMSFYELSREEREEIGIFDNLVRMSVGLEGSGELIADLDQALGVLG